MKLMFASDIHGSLYYTKMLVKQYEKEKAERLVLLGDLLYHGPRKPLTKEYNPAKVAEELNAYNEQIICVRGNCDSEVDQMVLKFPIKSDYTQVLVDNFNFFLTHGHLYQASDLPQSDCNIYVFGHTHIPVLKKEGVYLLNPGSVALPKEENPNTYAIYEDKQISIKTFDEKIIKQIIL